MECLIKGKHGQRTHSAKMGADKLAENLSAQIVFPGPKSCDFDEKRLHLASVVRATNVDILRHKSRQTAFRIQSAIQSKTYNIINFPFSHFQHVPRGGSIVKYDD